MANKYLRNIGASTNINDNNSWSTTSNGPADTTAPTAADIIILNAASGSSTILNINVDSEVGGMTATGYTGGWSGTGKFAVKQLASGNMTFAHASIVFDNLELWGYNDKLSQKLFASNLTVTNQLTLKGQSAINRLWIRSDTIGTKRTLSAGSVVLENVDFQDITFAGSATWQGTSVGGQDVGGNSGTITYTTPLNHKWRKSGGSGNWSDPTSWDTGVVPLCHDNVRFDADSILATGKTIIADMPRLGKDISFEGCLNSPALSFSQDSYIFGAPTFIAGMSFSGTAKILEFNSRTNFNITTANLSIPHALFFNNYGAEAKLIGNLIITFPENTYQALSFKSGGLDANEYNVSSKTIRASNPSIVTIKQGSGNWSITGSNASTWYFYNTNGLTNIEPSSSTIIFSNTDNTTKEFYNYLGGVNPVFNNIKFTGIGILKINNSCTFNQLESDTTAGAHTIQLTAGTTQTVQKLIVNSEPSKKTTINSTSATKANLNSANDQFIRNAILENIAFGGGGVWSYDADTVTVNSCTGLTAKNFNTFNTAKNTFNETQNRFGGNFTAKY